MPATRESAWPPTGTFAEGQTRTHASAMVGPVMTLVATGADTVAPWKPERSARVNAAEGRNRFQPCNLLLWNILWEHTNASNLNMVPATGSVECTPGPLISLRVHPVRL